ncbi:MAG: tRNA-dihydrouridine synthase family protein [Lentisphaeraceae bacterium]|nr:tRNA-dihydrouridine synthase family protein [Lentisphaeraceae bacterium]
MKNSDHKKFREKRQFPIRTSVFPYGPSTMLAPMEGVTNLVVREALNRLGGIGVLCTEFVRVSDHVLTPKMVKSAVCRHEGTPLSVQIMGNNASLMADSAARIADTGADIVDINLGCPTKKAAKGNVGAAMLKDPELLYEVLSAMRKNVPGWMSAKIRAGFEEADHVGHIASAVQASGVDFIAVHPRRRKDHYKGVSDWRIIARLKEQLDIPVVGNGDILYPQDALRMYKETNCDAVMIGRGVLRNPWIFKQIQELQESGNFTLPSSEEMIAFFEQLAVEFTESFEGREYATLARLKEFMGYYTKLFPDAVEMRKLLVRKQTLAELLEALFAILHKQDVSLMDFTGQN